MAACCRASDAVRGEVVRMKLSSVSVVLHWMTLWMSVVGAVRLLGLLSIRSHASGDLAEDLLQAHLMPWQPLDVVERLHVDEAVGGQRSEGVERVIPRIGEVGSDRGGDLVRLEEVDYLVALSLEVRVHLPNRREAMQVLRVVLAEEVDDEVDAVRRLLLLDLLRQPREEQRHRRRRAVAACARAARLLHLALAGVHLPADR
mmetsp:Transcript_127102/g.367940  ORF Transcript_127102/g.367940 Transcript_127102/m.367940 type:complete len:202 (+) Transcript_127102:109-714(+)